MPRGIAKNPLEKSRKISKAKKGKPNGHLGLKQSEETKIKIGKANTGKKRTTEQKENISKGHLGLHCSPKTEFKKGFIPSEKMRKMSRERWIGENNPRWNNGATSLRKKIRECFKYRLWRSDVFTRDGFICQKCGIKGGILHADHYPKSFAQIIKEYNIKTLDEALNCEELWNINNGRTLCFNCHKKTDNYLNKHEKQN